MFSRNKLTTSVMISLGLTVPGTTFAQDSENRYRLEEIVVTARKTNESIQDIPLSVQAFSAETIRKQQITDVEDLVAFTPGVVMHNQLGSRNNPAISFRSIESSSERNKQTSSAFVDGVYLPGSSQWVSMNDVERVEVVKGPQSAFFGRATFGGAINFVTRTPGNELKGDITAIIGDHGRQDIWLAAEGAIIEDKLAVRVSGRFYEFDGGVWDNSPPPGGAPEGRQFGDLGAQETTAGSITLYATPTDNLAIKLRYAVTEDDDGPSPIFLVKGENNNCGPFGTGTASYYCGTLSTDLISNGVSSATDPIVDTTYKSDIGLDREITMTTLNVDWDVMGSGYTLTSVTGWYEDETQDYRTLLEDELDVFLQWKDESFSQEFRLASPQDQRFRWMVGAYYLDLEYFGDGLSGFPSAGVGPFTFNPTTGGFDPRGGRGLFGVNPVPSETIENKAIFGSIAYDITEQLTVNLELRREEETISTGSSLIQEAMPLDSSTDELAILTRQPFGGAEVPIEGEFKATLPRVIVDYKLSDDTMLYLSYAEGNNPGGFNPEVIRMEPTVAFEAFTADTGIGYTVEQAELISYEFGAKHTLANGRGFINGAIYMMEWGNQRFRGFLTNVDSNGDGRFILGSDELGGQIDFDDNGSTDIWGFELAGGYALGQNWVVSAGYNYNDSEIQVYEDGVNGRVYGERDASGFETARAPDHTATVGLDFFMPSGELLGGGGEWYARYDGRYQSESYNWTVNLAKTEAAWLHNLRGGWRNDKYSVTAWVENVLDDDPVLASARTTGSFATGTLGYQLTIPTPRTFGLTVTASFGGQ
ncbi:MAG: iron complex outermembrane receptor protein [Halieaceae bacterium]|jgi:iron complex outermembrane receptor protein